MNTLRKIGILIRTLFIFFILLYGLFFIILKIFISGSKSISSEFFATYIFIIVPIISFFTIPKYLIKKHKFNKYFVWIFDVVIVYAMAIGFTLYALSTFTWGGF